jgi:hypothetical protein
MDLACRIFSPKWRLAAEGPVLNLAPASMRVLG